MQKITKLTQDALRKALLATPEGSTVIHLAYMLNEDKKMVQNMLRRCYGCYVVGYKNSPTTGAQQAVWRCVQVPKNARRPPSNWSDPERRKQYMRDYHLLRKEGSYVAKKARKNKAPAEVAVAPVPQQSGEYKPRTTWVKL